MTSFISIYYDIGFCRCKRTARRRKMQQTSLARTLTRGPDRQIGPIGTASRMIGGLAFIAVPVALEGIGWWDVGAALVALPLITLALGTLVTAGYRRYAPKALARPPAICSGPTCTLLGTVVAAAIVLTIFTPAGEIAIWAFLGASMLVAALRGYAGCEVLAIPNSITGRSDQIGCMLYTPIDRAEARGRSGVVRPV
jgi:hypothetical protein